MVQVQNNLPAKVLYYGLLVTGPAYGTQQAISAYQFAQAILIKGHNLRYIFFYQQGVANGSYLACPANDEFNLYNGWCNLARCNNVKLIVCVAAALRAGVLDYNEAQLHDKSNYNLTFPFRLGGLSEMAQCIMNTDRWLQF